MDWAPCELPAVEVDAATGTIGATSLTSGIAGNIYPASNIGLLIPTYN